MPTSCNLLHLDLWDVPVHRLNHSLRHLHDLLLNATNRFWSRKPEKPQYFQCKTKQGIILPPGCHLMDLGVLDDAFLKLHLYTTFRNFTKPRPICSTRTDLCASKTESMASEVCLDFWNMPHDFLHFDLGHVPHYLPTRTRCDGTKHRAMHLLILTAKQKP